MDLLKRQYQKAQIVLDIMGISFGRPNLVYTIQLWADSVQIQADYNSEAAKSLTNAGFVGSIRKRTGYANFRKYNIEVTMT